MLTSWGFIGSGDSPVGSSENFKTNIVRVGINYRLAPGSP